RPRVTAAHEGGAGIEAQSAALLLRAVAPLAVLRQQRTHLLLEEVLRGAAGAALIGKRRTCRRNEQPAAGEQSGEQTTKHVANLNEAGRRKSPSAAGGRR